MKRLLIATLNPGKIREFAAALLPTGIEAFGLDYLDDMTEVEETGSTFEENARLKAEGITPSYCVNHGFQFSLYYNDPDHNEVELGCDNFATRKEMNDWFDEGHFAKNFYGHNFDPEEVYKWHAEGVSDAKVFTDTYKPDEVPDFVKRFEGER